MNKLQKHERNKVEEYSSDYKEESSCQSNMNHLICMVTAMATLSGTYELLRSASTALITSEATVNVSLLMSLSTPFSFLLLVWYNYEMRLGSRHTMMRTTTAIGFFFLLMSTILKDYLQVPSSEVPYSNYLPSLTQLLTAVTYLMCESCYHLICTQQWTYILLILTEKQGKQLFAPIGGVCSISGAIAGALVKALLEYMSISSMLGVGGILLLVTAILSDYAYEMVDDHEDNSTYNSQKKNLNKTRNEQPYVSTLERCRCLFRREPLLFSLACEVIASQAFSTLLNVSYMSRLKKSLPLESDRAGWTGRFYSYVNASSAILQFAAVPLLMKKVGQHHVWMAIPTIMLISTIIGNAFGCSSLFGDSMSFGLMKIMEYSTRGVAIELVYISLDAESRSSGKQMISTFGIKCSKTLTSLVLTAVTTVSNPDSLPIYFSWMKLSTTCIWLYFAYGLAKRIKRSPF